MRYRFSEMDSVRIYLRYLQKNGIDIPEQKQGLGAADYAADNEEGASGKIDSFCPWNTI